MIKNQRYNSHINSLHSSISRLVGLNYSMRKFLNKQNLLKFYNVQIKTKMQNGILVRGCTSNSELNVLKRLQNRFIGSVCFLRKFNRVDHLFKLHRILPIHKLYIYVYIYIYIYIYIYMICLSMRYDCIITFFTMII